MAVEFGIWRVDGSPVAVAPSKLEDEVRLETWLTEDISLLGLDVLVIGRQVSTSYGGIIDLLAVDRDGELHVIELKRDKTPREVVA
jgi:Endonuclease NucS